jgi:hypothetical protein
MKRQPKTSAERSAFLDRKLDDYRARLLANPEYDRWYTRRTRLLSYRNHVFKALNRELSAASRKKYGKGERR